VVLTTAAANGAADRRLSSCHSDGWAALSRTAKSWAPINKRATPRERKTADTTGRRQGM